MINSKNNNFYFIFFVLAVISFELITFFAKPKPIKRTDYLAPPTIVKNLTFGLARQESDSFWLRALQDFDFCDQPVNGNECKGKSWLYNILDLASDLDPKFYEVTYFGGLALSVIISDYEGATKIFEKGVREFPNKWQLNYAAGYHAYFEEKDKLKASKLFFAAGKNGAPDWVQVSAGKFAADGGDRELAHKILNEMIKSSEDPKLIERLETKLKSLSQ